LQNHKKVIPFSRTGISWPERRWQFFDYLENGQNVIEPWYQGLSESGQDTFDDLVKLNAKTPLPANWGCSKVLQGEYKEEGLWEWRFFSNDRQQRVVGMFGIKRKEAVFLIGCSHKGKIYTPPRCLDTALKRAKEVRKGVKVNERPIEPNL
jgi:hypothetical protein